jgi:hypothetical protein
MLRAAACQRRRVDLSPAESPASFHKQPKSVGQHQQHPGPRSAKRDCARDLKNQHRSGRDILDFKGPYRFVFLDGCSTASSGEWRKAFGILPIWATAANQAERYQLGPQAFVGWASEVGSWLTSVPNDAAVTEIDIAYTTTLNNFYERWMGGATLKQCIDNACASNFNAAPFLVPANRNTTISGLFGEVPYSYSFTNMITSKIYVVGHSGLTRTRAITNFDNFYSAPVNIQ